MYPYKYCVVTFIDDGYSEHHFTSMFCDYEDANSYYASLVETCTPCLFYRINKFANLKL